MRAAYNVGNPFVEFVVVIFEVLRKDIANDCIILSVPALLTISAKGVLSQNAWHQVGFYPCRQVIRRAARFRRNLFREQPPK